MSLTNQTTNRTLLGPFPSSSTSDPHSTLVRDWIIMVLYLGTALIAVLGNVFVCVTIHRKGRLSSTTYALIYNMAVSDILGGVVIPAQWALCATAVLDSGLPAIESGCGILKTAQVLSYYVSSLTMAAVAYDRYLLVCRPMSARVSLRPLLVAIWALGCLFVTGNVFTLRIFEFFSPTKVCFVTTEILFLKSFLFLPFPRV